MKLWSFDVRSWGPIQVTLWREKRASLEGWGRSGQVPSHCLFREHRINVGVRPHYDLHKFLLIETSISQFPRLAVSSVHPLE